ncbi:MAG: ArsR family transcriptional regulator [Promethearchaeota archaeon]|nr:MAG: ArsR family transcriptional regulator [Candidatus Lokiarchaeota archaeon]
MDDSKDILLEIREEIKKLDGKITFLQDCIFSMKNELDLLKKSKIQENYFTRLTKIADDNLIKFLDNRPKDCAILDYCTTMIEKGVLKILRTLMEKGEEAALLKIEKYMKFSNSEAALKACPNHDCLGNVGDTFKLLKELIIDSRELSLRYLEELNVLDQEVNLTEENVAKLNNLLAPLSNVLRLKILKTLNDGAKFYTQMEEQTGIKAGHLSFHVEKLKDAGYVIQQDKKYMITLKGRKALNLISRMNKELSI